MANPASFSETRVYDELLTTTTVSAAPVIVDNAINHHPLVGLLTGRLGNDMFGRVNGQGRGKETVESGESFEVRVKLGKNPTAKMMTSGFDTWDQSTSDTARTTRANKKLGGATIIISGQEKRANRGSARIVDLLTYKMTDAVTSFVDLLAEHLFDSGSVTERVSGLEQIISANDSIQGYTGATYADWNSRGLSAKGTSAGSISFTGGSFATTGLANWRTAYLNCSEGSEQPDVLVTTDLIHTYYEATLAPEVRFTSTVSADLGIQALAFKTKPVFNDPFCTSGATYFLNFGHLMLKVMSGADFDVTPMADQQFQDVWSSKVVWEGQLCTSGRKFQNAVRSQTA